ncbi:hypothetical protein BOH78_0794 [Pichia kudriavzevii]|uniref:Uncharacterized protein n=1 Tax=Pichia kudriavzevii TaxID=4909 RepID=A0A099NSD6_PICKU|nr:hypothetical protein JL09_g5370 [Pichia kudriavzevii]ONH76915.1 hypothetical protein BOH78_0794 [Pichia kudriavzevii]
MAGKFEVGIYIITIPTIVMNYQRLFCDRQVHLVSVDIELRSICV